MVHSNSTPSEPRQKDFTMVWRSEPGQDLFDVLDDYGEN